MTNPIPPAPPGWYYAPGDPQGTHRYWDGELWQGQPTPVPGAQAPYGAAGYTNHSYAGWGTRAGASLVDWLLVAVALGGAVAVAALIGTVSDSLGVVVGVALGLPVLLGALYLLLWLPGVTGQSPGRRVMGYEIVSERDGTYIGGGAFLGREIIGSVINNFCYIDYLWPLWDDKNQRLADKVVSSVAVQKDAGKLFPLFPSGKPF